jgi:Cys-rich protein (TIGR01571 family)
MLATEGGRPLPDWKQGICGCGNNEEACWWGTWCCWLLQGRNHASFGIGSPSGAYLCFWSTIIVSLLLFIILPGFFPFIMLGAWLFYSNRSGDKRSQIRRLRSIPGNNCNDWMTHCCCSCCATCQEATEVDQSGIPPLDLCSGQPLSDIATATEFNDLALSSTTRTFLYISGTVALLVSYQTFYSSKPGNVGILLLIFLQPAIILYFVYWRKRRSSTPLDNVLKMFLVGFWLTSFQSGVIEMVLQGAGFLLLSALGPAQTAQNVLTDDTQKHDSNIDTSSILSSSLHDAFIKLFSNNRNSYNHLVESFQHSSMTDQSESEDGNISDTLNSNMALILLTLFLMAFVMAAGVEETMKHFAVRCCRFPQPFTDPHAVLVTLVSSALGFATCENIGYVLGSNMNGVDYYTAEIITLSMRVLMPIHFLCAVLQATELSKVALQYEPLSLFSILLPAILLHGTFDFILFFGAFFSAIYSLDGWWYEALFLVVPVGITACGAWVSYKRFSAIQKIYEQGWRAFSEDDEEQGIGMTVMNMNSNSNSNSNSNYNYDNDRHK